MCLIDHQHQQMHGHMAHLFRNKCLQFLYCIYYLRVILLVLHTTERNKNVSEKFSQLSSVGWLLKLQTWEFSLAESRRRHTCESIYWCRHFYGDNSKYWEAKFSGESENSAIKMNWQRQKKLWVSWENTIFSLLTLLPLLFFWFASQYLLLCPKKHPSN